MENTVKVIVENGKVIVERKNENNKEKEIVEIDSNKLLNHHIYKKFDANENEVFYQNGEYFEERCYDYKGREVYFRDALGNEEKKAYSEDGLLVHHDTLNTHKYYEYNAYKKKSYCCEYNIETKQYTYYWWKYNDEGKQIFFKKETHISKNKKKVYWEKTQYDENGSSNIETHSFEEEIPS